MPPLSDNDVGALATNLRSALTGTVVAVTTVAVLLYAVFIKNTTGAAAYLQLFDAAAADVTLGTTTPKLSLGLAASESQWITFAKPVKFATAIAGAGTTTVTGSTGAALDVNFFFG